MSDNPTSGGPAPFALPIMAQVPVMYANGFGTLLTGTEITVVFVYDSNPAVRIVLPFSVAKSLTAAILSSVSQYEQATGQSVRTVEELGPLMATLNQR